MRIDPVITEATRFLEIIIMAYCCDDMIAHIHTFYIWRVVNRSVGSSERQCVKGQIALISMRPNMKHADHICILNSFARGIDNPLPMPSGHIWHFQLSDRIG
jgi:hypothetical protein